VAQGHTVFVISCVNPYGKLAGKDFEDYLTDGTLAAIGAIGQATGAKDVNAIGYCLGGTLLAATLGWMAAKKDRRIASATFMTSLVDFTHAGELEVFIDEAQVASLERKMRERGYLEGSEMASTFNMLRANDLMWSFVVNNYLMGKDPFPFDLLYWNSDSTRMPAAMHSFYLRNMYLDNLRVPGKLKMLGQKVDLGKVDVPAYLIAAREDHIVPWKSAYLARNLLGGDTRFVLGASGHIAGGKLAADADYGAAVAGGGELFTGSVADGLLNVISGMPSEPTDYAYVTAVHATAANGQIGAAMQQGVALAAAATATGGLNTVFGAEVTGQYGGVRWLTGAPSIAAMEESMHAINGDPSFLALVDAGGAVYQPNATQALFRRIS